MWHLDEARAPPSILKPYIDADEPISFAVEDFELVEMTHEGEAIDESDSLSGKFQATVIVRAKPTGI